MAGRAVLSVAALLLLLVAFVHAQPLEVVMLTPKTFEHETQAATGQTTGQWCVLFTNSSASSGLQVAAEDAWEHLAEDEDKATIMAKVDLSSGGAALSKRFNLSSTPAAILFRDRSMYTLDLAATAADADKIAAAVHAFMDGGYEHQVPHAVPREASLLDVIWDATQMLGVNPTPMLWAGIICLAIGFMLFLAFVTAGVYYMYAPDKPQPKKKDAAVAASPAGGAGIEEDDAAVVQDSSDSKPNTTRATRRRAA